MAEKPCSRKVLSEKRKKAEVNDDDFLPHNWIKKTEIKNGALVECYKNPKTKQTFHSEEDYTRYMHYVTEIRPRLRANETTCSDYMEAKGNGEKEEAGGSSLDPMAGEVKQLAGKEKMQKQG